MARNSLASQPVDAAPRASARIQERAMATDRVSDRGNDRRLERPANQRKSDDGRFAIDLNAVPPGYVMEWKRHEIMGLRDKQNLVKVRAYHWQPVSHSQQPQILGHLCKNADEHIVVDGLGLYMRPAYLNEDAAREAEAEADYQLSQQLHSLKLTSRDQVGDKFTKIKKQTVQVSQPVE